MATTVTVTVKSSGGDYTSLNAAFQGEVRDLVTADEIARIDCYPFEDTTPVNINQAGWTTDATRYVELRFVDSGGTPLHTATWSTSAYRLVIGGAGSAEPFDNTGVDHLWHTAGTFQIADSGNTGISQVMTFTGLGAGFQRFDGGGILVLNHGESEGVHGVLVGDSSPSYRFRNWIMYGGKTSASFSQALRVTVAATVVCENCTFDDFHSAFHLGNASTDITATNCRATDMSLGVVSGASSADLNASSDFNLTDGSAPTNWGTNSIDSTDSPTIAYVDDSNATLTDRDYQIGGSDSGVEAGTDLSGSFTIDVAGTTRTAPWDIGAHEQSVAGGPADPTNVVAANPTSTTIDLTWTDGAAVPHRVYFRTPAGGGAWTLFSTVNAGIEAETVTGLTAGTEYDVGVAAFDDPDESDIVFDTLTTAPAPPTGVTASNPSDTTIDVDWTDATAGTAQHRVFWRETGSGDPWMVFSTLPAGTTSETVTGLTAGTGYDIGVASYDSANDLESAIVFDTATTTGGSGSLTPPSGLAVTGFSATSVSLSWTDTTGGFFEHRVYYRTPPTSGSYILFSTLANEFSTETVTGLDPNTNYELGVASWDGASESTKAEITQMTATARWVDGALMLGTQGDTVIEGEEGAIPQDTGASDGAGAKTLPKGVRSGSVAHLGTVEFAEPYDSVPLVVYAGGGLSMEQRAKWGTKAAVDAGTASDAAPTSNAIYQDVVFEVDATGFTAFLRLRTNAALTAESAALGTPTTLTATGTTGEATPDSADLPAFDDRYSVSYSGELQTNKGGPASMTVTLEARLNGGSWTEIASGQHVTTFPSGGGLHEFTGDLVGVISDMDGSGLDQFRCRMKSLSLAGSVSSAEAVFGPNVTWSTSSPDYASMTPESGDEASFVVIGNAGSA